MRHLYSYSITTNFKDNKALRVFVRDATRVAVKIARRIASGETETLSLFVNNETGHIRIWCREEDSTASILETRSDTRYRRIPWQVRGTKDEEGSVNEDEGTKTPLQVT